MREREKREETKRERERGRDNEKRDREICSLKRRNGPSWVKVDGSLWSVKMREAVVFSGRFSGGTLRVTM